jgi:hypothetical protein
VHPFFCSYDALNHRARLPSASPVHPASLLLVGLLPLGGLRTFLNPRLTSSSRLAIPRYRPWQGWRRTCSKASTEGAARWEGGE